ncbi:MAG: DUF1501 domain-containing protein [Acidobacteria bacterium]|nr:DUF1501 domain-containing protein [Acidobacteriota bacterium]
MNVTRREFVRGGVAAFTVGFAAPEFLSELALAQGSTSRTLVVLYLGGGNDSLSMLVPYTDSFYYSRRPTIAIPAGSVLQVGSDKSGKPLGLNPRLVGMHAIFNAGQMAVIQRTGYQNSSRSHFTGTDIWSTALPNAPQTTGWLGRYLDLLPSPVDPLVGWSTVRETPHALRGRLTAVPSIQNPATYGFSSPNTGAEAALERTFALKISSHVPVERPHLAFVNGTAQAALATLDRVVPVAQYAPTVTYPNNGLGQALKAIAGALVKGIGTKVFWVQTGGYDTHSTQGVNFQNGAYTNLMGILDGGLAAFYSDLKNQSLLDQTLIVQFSEFGRRITENGSSGTDHGAAGLMFAIGGKVNGGIYGTAASLNPDPSNPTLENNGGDVRFEMDFRSVYARVIDNWLGADSRQILNADFRQPGLSFI